MNRTIAVLNKHPFLALALSVLVAIPLGALVVAATLPDPGAKQLAMSWQKGKPAPFPNIGVDRFGMTLDQWTASGRKPHDWQPILTETAQAGGSLSIGRYMLFENKMTHDAMIHRRWVCGEGVSGISDYPLPSIPPPTFTNGPSVKNHRVPVPKDLLPEGVTSRKCEYRASAEFVTRNPMRSAWYYFPPVPVTIVR